MLISCNIQFAGRSTNKWQIGDNDEGAFPPIGLMYIAGYLRRHAPHHDIKIIDANVLRYSQGDIEREVMAFQPDIVGITVLSPMLYDCLETMKTVKNVSKDIAIAVGGACPTYHVEAMMAYPTVDFVGVGEGEVLFAELLDALEGNRELGSVQGLVYRDESGKLVQNGGTGYIENLNELPHPAFDLVPFEKYFSMIGTGAATGILSSSRGCPHRCTYCSKLYDNYRGRSPENIIEEMRLYYDKGIREFMFFDDMFNVTSKRAQDIATAIRHEFSDIKWSFRGRADQLTEALAVELKASGCEQVSLGAEAHKNEIQKALKTGKSVEAIRKAVQILKKHRIHVNTNWIVGLPQHKSAEDIKEMLKVAFEIDSHYSQFNILMLYDDTELYQEALERNLVDPSVWMEYIQNPYPNFLIPTWEEHLTREQLSKLLRYCWIRFYFRPKVVLRQLSALRNWEMFKTQLKGFFIMLYAVIFPLLDLLRTPKPDTGILTHPSSKDCPRI